MSPLSVTFNDSTTHTANFQQWPRELVVRRLQHAIEAKSGLFVER
jgi:hypothetical protein